LPGRRPGFQGSRHRPDDEIASSSIRSSPKIEKPAGIRQSEGLPQRGRQILAAIAGSDGGKNPGWTSYEKIREVIEKRIFSQVEDLLPVISFGSKKTGRPKEARRIRRALV